MDFQNRRVRLKNSACHAAHFNLKIFKWCKNIFLISLLESDFQRSVWSVPSISVAVLGLPHIKKSLVGHCLPCMIIPFNLVIVGLLKRSSFSSMFSQSWLLFSDNFKILTGIVEKPSDESKNADDLVFYSFSCQKFADGIEIVQEFTSLSYLNLSFPCGK